MYSSQVLVLLLGIAAVATAGPLRREEDAPSGYADPEDIVTAQPVGALSERSGGARPPHAPNPKFGHPGPGCHEPHCLAPGPLCDNLNCLPGSPPTLEGPNTQLATAISSSPSELSTEAPATTVAVAPTQSTPASVDTLSAASANWQPDPSVFAFSPFVSETWTSASYVEAWSSAPTETQVFEAIS